MLKDLKRHLGKTSLSLYVIVFGLNKEALTFVKFNISSRVSVAKFNELNFKSHRHTKYLMQLYLSSPKREKTLKSQKREKIILCSK